MSEKEQLKGAIDNLVRVIDDNPCGMGRAMFLVLSMLVNRRGSKDDRHITPNTQKTSARGIDTATKALWALGSQL